MPKNKMSKEELDAAAQKAVEEAEAIKAKGDEEDPPAPSPSPEPSIVNEEDPPAPSPSPEPPEDIYKKKAIEQQRENIVLHGKQKKMNDTLDQAANLPDPTEDELHKEYPEWEDMTQTEQRLAKQAMLSNKRFDLLRTVRTEERNVEAWNEKVDAFVSDPTSLVNNPELEGKIDEFVLFATKPTRVSVPFDVLVSAFLHDVTKKPAKKNSIILPTGEHRSNVKQTHATDKIGLVEARKLRENDYPKYREMLRAHKIDSTIE
jgi:hypothetical protein